MVWRDFTYFMEIAQLYYPIYLLIVSLFSIQVYGKYNKRINPILGMQKRNLDGECLILMFFMILFIGLRPVSGRYFGDMGNYVASYHAFYENVPFVFNPLAENILWDNWWALWGSMCLGTETFFLLSAAVYFVCTHIACCKWFPNDTFIAYLFFLAAFSTFSYTTNGCKAGNAAALFLVAMAYRDKLYVCIPFLLLSLGIHHSMKLPIVAFILASLYKNPKMYLMAWGICLLLSLAHITWFQVLFAQISADNGDAHGANYLLGSDTNGWGGKSGFRYDFVLYSAMPVWVGYYAVFKKKIKSLNYNFILNVYTILNSVWMLCMYAEFTNRIAYLSWFMYPFVLIYPLVCENWGIQKYRTLSKIMLYHLGFTLFMQIIYY